MKERILRVLTDYGIVLMLIVLVVYFTISTPNHIFITPLNLINITHQIAINTILGIGMTFVIITAGIDLSVGSVLAYCGLVAADMVKHGLHIGGVTILPNTPVPLAVLEGLLGALVVGGFIGSLNGVVITKFKVNPFIATLAAMTIVRGFAFIYNNSYPISNLPNSFDKLGGGVGGRFMHIPYPVWVALLLVVISHFVLSRTRFGRQVYAVGGNEEASRLSGVNTNRVKLMVYIIMGVLAGLAGVLQAADVSSADPQAGLMYELNAIAAVVLGGSSLMGGRGTILGTLLGALVIGVLNNGLIMLGISDFYQQVWRGVVILFAVLLDQAKIALLARQRRVAE